MLSFVSHVVLENHRDFLLHYLALFIMLLWNWCLVTFRVQSHITSTNDLLYYVTFNNACSRFTWIYLLKNKFDTFTVLKLFKAMVELEFSTKIKSLQTGWGGEFRPLAPYLANLGINHRLIYPHTHHQNGVVERKHRHIIELGLTLLNHASLPLKFQDFAFTIVVYNINRLPTTSLDFLVPYTTLLKNSLDYQFLKPFGCSCSPFLRPYNKHKLDFRSHECLFLGYSTSHRLQMSLLLAGCSFTNMSFLMSLDFFTLSCLNP